MLHVLRRAGLGLIAATTVFAQRPAAPPPAAAVPLSPLYEPGDKVSIALLTMGNGTAVWELFGHTAILIRDNATGRDTVFNWGAFDMTQPHFIPHFLEGLNLYEMAGETMDQLLYSYRYYNRSVAEQDLNLSTAQKDSLLSLIRTNALPQNLQYRYDYFVDNCSTRPRDLLNQVLGGQLRTQASVPGSNGSSYRWQTLRLMGGDRLLVLGVDIGLGEPADKPITKWQEMFLPAKLHDFVQTMQVRDSTGAVQPLVRRNVVLFQSTRPPEPTAPPDLRVWLWVIGLIVGGLIAWAGAAATRPQSNRGAAVVAGVLMSVWSFAAAILGVLLTLLWTVTDHRFAYSNENLLLFNPLWLLAFVLVIVSFASGRAWRWTSGLLLFLAALAALALLVHVVPVSRQVNLPVIGLALPPALAMAWVAWRGRARAESRVSAVRKSERYPTPAPQTTVA